MESDVKAVPPLPGGNAAPVPWERREAAPGGRREAAPAGNREAAPDGRRDRWTAHRAARRRQFVAAALRVLRDKGPDLPMEAVAAEAGVTKPVLYRYFSDKAALVDALAEHGCDLLLARVIPSIRSDGPVLARISDAVSAYFALIDEEANLYWLLARQPRTEGGADYVRRDEEIIAELLTAVIGDYLRACGLDSGAAEPLAYGVTGLVRTTAEWWLRRRSMSRDHAAGYVTQLIWAAFSGILREAGIALDPGRPLPTPRPALTLRAGARAAARPKGRVAG